MIKRVQIIFLPIFLAAISLHAQEKMNLTIVCTDKGNKAPKELLRVPNEFSSVASIDQFLRRDYIKGLWEKGYLAASIDSNKIENNFYRAFLFLGEQYAWGQLRWNEELPISLSSIQRKDFLPHKGLLLRPSSFSEWSDNLLNQLEENGYPFASIKIDSSYWIDQLYYARLTVDAGPLYHIDSVHLDTKMNIRPSFLQRYLGITPNQLYKRSLLMSVSKRIDEAGFIKEFKPWDLSLYGTGATLNVYVSPQKNNRFDLLAGLMPANPLLKGKAQITGEGNMELNNAFGSGEHVLVNWQQLQIQSPRLQLQFQRPYILQSNVGIDVNFNLLKKDSSYLNIFSKWGITYQVDQKQEFRFHLLQNIGNVLNIDTQWVKEKKQLTPFFDYTQTQMSIEWSSNRTDNRRNPLKGIEWRYQVATGLKKIKKQSEIVSMKLDATGKPYDYARLYEGISLSAVQSNTKLIFQQYNKLSTQSTLKLGLQAAWMYGKQLYLNEVYQIGGINTLRGFDEESIYASSYAIGTAEYRYFLDKESTVFGFFDAAMVQKKWQQSNTKGSYWGVGAGVHFFTTSGKFTLVYAMGKSDQQPFGLQRSKIHVGFSTFF